MGKFRVRGGSKSGKGARWEKGQSSSSNPKKKKHRDLAKSRMIHGGVTGAGGGGSAAGEPAFVGHRAMTATRLTAECLLRHEALMGQAATSRSASAAAADDDQPEDMEGGMSASTVKTFATDFR